MRRVPIHILLAGELLDGPHDRVGHLAERLAVLAAGPRTRGSKRLADLHAGLTGGWDTFAPMGCAMSVPIIATGMTGTPDSIAIRATPVLPR